MGTSEGMARREPEPTSAHVRSLADLGQTSATLAHELRNLVASLTGAVDLLDLAVVETLLKGGSVFVVPPEEIPADSAVVAVLRY